MNPYGYIATTEVIYINYKSLLKDLKARNPRVTDVVNVDFAPVPKSSNRFKLMKMKRNSHKLLKADLRCALTLEQIAEFSESAVYEDLVVNMHDVVYLEPDPANMNGYNDKIEVVRSTKLPKYKPSGGGSQMVNFLEKYPDKEPILDSESWERTTNEFISEDKNKV